MSNYNCNNEVEAAAIKYFINFCEIPELNECKINKKVFEKKCCLIIESPTVEIAEKIWHEKQICALAAAELKIADKILLFTKNRGLYAPAWKKEDF